MCSGIGGVVSRKRGQVVQVVVVKDNVFVPSVLVVVHVLHQIKEGSQNSTVKVGLDAAGLFGDLGV